MVGPNEMPITTDLITFKAAVRELGVLAKVCACVCLKLPLGFIVGYFIYWNVKVLYSNVLRQPFTEKTTGYRYKKLLFNFLKQRSLCVSR